MLDLRFRGVHMAHNRWVAGIVIDKKRVSLGGYETQEEAAKAYDEARIYQARSVPVTTI